MPGPFICAVWPILSLFFPRGCHRRHAQPPLAGQLLNILTGYGKSAFDGDKSFFFPPPV